MAEKLTLKEKLAKKREKSNGNSKPEIKIPFERQLWLRGENATVKLLKCLKTGESMHEMYKTTFTKDVDGNPISIKSGDKTINKVTYPSPKSNGELDAIIEYRTKCWNEHSESEYKQLTEEAKKPKAINWVLADVIEHKDKAGQRVVIPFNGHMLGFMTDNMCDIPLKELVKENDKISIKKDKYIIPDEYVVTDIADGTIVCDNTITEIEAGDEIIINNKSFRFESISGNTLTGVRTKTYTEDELFGWDGEYLLELSSVTELDGNYNNYSINSRFTHISKIKSLNSANGVSKYSDIRDIEAVKNDIPFALTDAGGNVLTYEQSYWRFHKYFLKKTDEQIKTELAEKKKDNVETATTEQTTTSKEAKTVETTNVPKEEPKASTKLKIADSDLESNVTDFEKKMETVENVETTQDDDPLAGDFTLADINV